MKIQAIAQKAALAEVAGSAYMGRNAEEHEMAVSDQAWNVGGWTTDR
jgi:hypothetical protein